MKAQKVLSQQSTCVCTVLVTRVSGRYSAGGGLEELDEQPLLQEIATYKWTIIILEHVLNCVVTEKALCIQCTVIGQRALIIIVKQVQWSSYPYSYYNIIACTPTHTFPLPQCFCSSFVSSSPSFFPSLSPSFSPPGQP